METRTETRPQPPADAEETLDPVDPADWEALTGVAVGYPGDPSALSDMLRQREEAPRTRKPLESFVFAGSWKTKSPLLD